MTEGNDTNSNGTQDSSAGNAETAQLSITQAELDKLISDRIERARKTWTAEQQKAGEEAKRQAEIDKLQGEEKLNAQHKLETDKLTAERDSYQRQLRIANARAELSQKGLDASFAETLIGKDDEATKANIANFEKMVNEQVSAKVNEGLHKGAPPASTEASGQEDPIKTKIYKGFGLL